MEIEKERNKIGSTERWLSLAGGAAAIYYGAKRKSLLGSALAIAGGGLAARGLTGQSDVLVYLGLMKPAKGSLPYGQVIKIRRSIIVNRSPEELYRFWHNFQNLPNFMNNIESVQTLGERRSHWVMSGPGGTTIEWDAEIIADEPNRMIGWRSIGGRVDHAGSVRFERATGSRGTVVRVQLQYNPPGGRIGATVAKLFGRDPDQAIREDLARFKELMETGEIPTAESRSSGRVERRRTLPSQRARGAGQGHGSAEAPAEASFPASDAPVWTAGSGI